MISKTFCTFIDEIIERHEEKIFLILDNATYHTSAETQLYMQKYRDRLEVFLPAYAPELNPAELMWAHVKSHGINKVFVRNRSEFVAAVDIHLQRLARDQSLCKAFFGNKKLRYIDEDEALLAA